MFGQAERTVYVYRPNPGLSEHVGLGGTASGCEREEMDLSGESNKLSCPIVN